MEGFKNLYLNACLGVKVKPDERLLDAIGQPGSDSETILNFLQCMLSYEACQCLGLSLSKDVFLTHLNFKNCMIQEKGLEQILKGLIPNKALFSLNLMGNNIRSSGTLSLAQMLRHNTHLQELLLDWNSLGIVPENFTVFCEGLSTNNTLKVLDLGHNQLNHQCAVDLSHALLKNTSLEFLRVHFNNFGLIGGAAILKSLIQNHTLIELDIQGNNIGLTAEHSIELALKNNQERIMLRTKHVEEARLLSNRLHDVESEKNKQVKELLETIERTESQTSSARKINLDRIFELDAKLAMKEDELKNMNSKHQELEKNLSSAENKLKDLENLYKEVESESHNREQKHLATLEAERKVKSDLEASLSEKITSQEENISSLLQQVEDVKKEKISVDRSLEKQNNVILELEQRLKESEQEFDEKIRILKEQQDQDLNDVKESNQKDISKLNKEYVMTEQNNSHKIKFLETQKKELELEVVELKDKMGKLKLENEERLELHRKELKEEKDRLNKLMDEKISFVEVAKEKQQQLLKDQVHRIDELQSKNTKITLELEDQTHQVQYLKQLLSESEDVRQVEVAKVKLEVKEQLEELAEQKSQKQQLLMQIDQLNKDIAAMKEDHSKELQTVTEQGVTWRKELELVKEKLQANHEEAIKRASKLQTIFSKYMNDVQQDMLELS